MKRNKKIGLFIFIVSMCLFPSIVNAQEGNLCFPSGMYTIKWDENQFPNFSLNSVKESDLLGETKPSGNVNYEWTKIASKCYLDGGKPIACSAEYKDVTKSAEVTLNESTYKYTVRIKDDGKTRLRVFYDSRDKNMASLDISEMIKLGLGNQFVSSSNGYFTITNVSPGAGIYIETYLNNNRSECNGLYIGISYLSIPKLDDVEVNNPAIQNPNGYGCNLVKANTKMSEDFKKKYIPECYSQKIPYSQLKNLASTIKQKYDNALKIYNSFPDSTSNTSNSAQCILNGGTKDSIISSTKTIEMVGNYWMLVCHENLTTDPDDPKLTYAGGGFNYHPTYKVSRTCSLVQTNVVHKKPQCQHSYRAEVYAANGKLSNTENTNWGGPNEDFDNCVMNCDNGTYTQTCINKCYNQVYGGRGSTRNLTFSKNDSKMSTLIQKGITKNNVLRTSDDGSVLTIPADSSLINYDEDNTVTGTWRGKEYQYVPGTIEYPPGSGNSVYIQMSTTGSNGGCYNNSNETIKIFDSVGPAGCTDNADSEYNNAVQQSMEEFYQYYEIQKSYENIKSGTYTVEIQDSYLRDSKGKSYIFKVDSNNNPKVTIDEKTSGSSNTSVTANFGDSGGGSVTYDQIAVRNKTFTINLPESHVSRVNGEIAYTTRNDTINGYNVNTKTSGNFNKVIEFSSSRYYLDGYKYFTSIWSNNINVNISKDGAVTLKTNPETPNNIKVHVKGAGTTDGTAVASLSSDTDCYYGVYNNFYCPTPEDCPNTGTGIQYIYRVIDLEDVFPNNREPRWNWTGTINGSKATGAASFSRKNGLMYDVDPVSLTNDIESKGKSIYEVKKDASEVDYEFVLTKENIRNIRSYNKHVDDYNGDGEHNYADYNMSCYVNNRGKEVCTSKFLDNINGNSGGDSSANYITYSVGGFTIDARKNLAGCNNSKNLTCIDTYR